MRKWLGLFAAMILYGCSTTVPTQMQSAPEIVVDGRFEPGEWDGSQEQAVGDARLRTRIFNEELLVAIDLPAGSLRYVDLYVQDTNGGVLNLHTSMRQGERVLTSLDREGGPPFTWEPKSGWQGSTAPRTKAPRTRPIREWLAPYQGYEMRIPLRLLGPWPWRVRYEIRDFEEKGADWVYPADSTLSDPATWAELR